MASAFVGRYSRNDFSGAARRGDFAVRGSTLNFARHAAGAHCELWYVQEASSQAPAVGLLCGEVTNFERLAHERSARRPSEAACRDALELVARVYEDYGIPGFRLLEGLFVGVLLIRGQLVLFASKTPGPTLYFGVDASQETLWFGTELKAFPESLRRMRDFAELAVEPDEARARNTCFREVFRVRSGHALVLGDSSELSFQEVRYYSVLRAFADESEEACAEQLRQVVTRAVQSVPGQTANCLVSGGLDSSIVAAVALQQFSKVRLFSLGSAQRNEFAAAQTLVEHLGVGFERLLIEPREFVAVLPELIYLLEHCHSTFVEYLLPVHLAYRKIAHSADVVLSGYGSDVLFAGFARQGDTLAHVTRLVEEEYGSTEWSNEASQTLGGYLGLEVGYPFFHSAVVDFSFTVDPYLKHKNGVEKYILRRAFAPLLGERVAFRPKLGVHQGTGSEDYISSLLGDPPAATRRRAKDRLCYEVLRVLLTENARPGDVDVHALVNTTRAAEGLA